MKNLRYASTVFLMTILMAVSNGCDKMYESGFVPMPVQPISGAVEIGSDWMEFTPLPPLRTLADARHYVNVRYRDYKRRNEDFTDENGKALYLSDNRQTVIDAVLFDEKGQSYDLKIGGVGDGFNLYLKQPAGEEKTRGASLENKVFTKLKIRSEIPFKCEGIQWVSYIPK